MPERSYAARSLPIQTNHIQQEELMRTFYVLIIASLTCIGCVTPPNNALVTAEQRSTPPAWVLKPGQLPPLPGEATGKSKAHIADIYRFCYPDCYADSFDINNPYYANFVIGNCHYRVEYFTRKACDEYCDIYISRVFSLDQPPCGSQTSSAGSVLDYAQTAAIRDALTHGYLDDCKPQAANECNTNWRITKGLCWRWGSGSPPYYYQILYNCDDDACCLCNFTVCKNQDGSYSVTKNSCTGDDPTLCSPGCNPVCE
jgi:hypothetical protein